MLLETLSEVSPDALEAMRLVRETGLPLWVSLRRGRADLETDADLRRLVGKLEAQSVDALLLNCLQPADLAGAVPILRELTEIPLGIYPRLGRDANGGWEFDTSVGQHEFAELAAGWRAEGASIVGGCCGTTPDHLAAARRRLGARSGQSILERS